LSISEFNKARPRAWSASPWRWRFYDPKNRQELFAQWRTLTPQKTQQSILISVGLI